MAEPEVRLPYETRARRKHKKARTGCGICKKRRIKCDEGKPACANCVKHRVRCDFARLHSLAANETSAQTQAQFPLHVHSPNSTPPSRADEQVPVDIRRFELRTPPLAGGGHSSQLDHDLAQIPAKELIRLELLHNYNTLTSLTLSGDPVLKNVWRINVPKVGFSYTFVLRSIFALSALHISLYSVEKRELYLKAARCQHSAALQDIVAELSHLTSENCSAIYIASVLTFFYAWASPHQEGDTFLINDSGPSEWISSLKGVNEISRTWKMDLCNGPFGMLFQLGNSGVEVITAKHQTSTAWMSTTEHIQLTSLRRTIASAAYNVQAAAVYKKSIDVLEVCFCTSFFSSNVYRSQVSNPITQHDFTSESSLPVTATTIVHWWLFTMEDDFIEFLNKRDPLTLVIFCHFCVLLKSLSSYWWTQGWLSNPLREIWNVLDERHRLWIRWPIEEIGWSPSM
ncbi:hypothetical protein GGI43DRAFT_414812 [Trichoderma evansii]